MTVPEKQVCIVDNDHSVRTAISRLLRAAGYEVTAFPSALAFLDEALEAPCHCLLLDVHMPDLDGLQLQSLLNERIFQLPIVFLTGHGDIPMSVQAMKSGAVDFLTKPVDEDCLLKAIEAAISIGREQRLANSRQLSIDRRLKRLSPRELEVLRCLLTGALNKQVAAHLGIVEKTVKVHRARMLEKMEVHSIAALVHLCLEVGVEPIHCLPS